MSLWQSAQCIPMLPVEVRIRKTAAGRRLMRTAGSGPSCGSVARMMCDLATSALRIAFVCLSAASAKAPATPEWPLSGNSFICFALTAYACHACCEGRGWAGLASSGSSDMVRIRCNPAAASPQVGFEPEADMKL